MPVPWLRLLDAAIGVGTIARRVTQSRASRDVRDDLTALGAGGPLEARLAGVVVAALKEAFDRDRQRLDAEREQMDVERQRAERLLRLELVRQAGDREIGRLRLVAAIAVVSWLTTLFLVTGTAGAAASRLTMGAGWIFLLGALGSALAGQSQVVRALDRVGAGTSAARVTVDDVSSGAAGTAAGWLTIVGLTVIGAGVLLI
jgi:hypothetical protein